MISTTKFYEFSPMNGRSIARVFGKKALDHVLAQGLSFVDPQTLQNIDPFERYDGTFIIITPTQHVELLLEMLHKESDDSLLTARRAGKHSDVADMWMSYRIF